jgi:RsmE family RNA methyltransferase
LNLLLFEDQANEILLPTDDPRTIHVRKVLRRLPGDGFDVAVVNGPKGKATILDDGTAGLRLSFLWQESIVDDRNPIRLLVGLPRPQTARKILQQAASLGVEAMDFFGTDKGEPSYADSKLWSSGEWRRHLLRGVEQAFSSFLPIVNHNPNLEAALAELSGSCSRFALDVYEAASPLTFADSGLPRTPCRLAVGPERGWSEQERELLRESEFEFRHLGHRVLREETACVVALGILSSGCW